MTQVRSEGGAGSDTAILDGVGSVATGLLRSLGIGWRRRTVPQFREQSWLGGGWCGYRDRRHCGGRWLQRNRHCADLCALGSEWSGSAHGTASRVALDGWRHQRGLAMQARGAAQLPSLLHSVAAIGRRKHKLTARHGDALGRSSPWCDPRSHTIVHSIC